MAELEGPYRLLGISSRKWEMLYLKETTEEM